MRIFTPCNKVKLENVSTVTLKKCGKRFEVACYVNRLYDYQRGLLPNVSDVLQTEAIFQNVSKGQLAKKEDLVGVFGSAGTEKIAIQILESGTVQLSQKERDQRLEKQLKEISFLICEMCVNPETGLAHSQRTIERAIKEAQVSVNATKSAKQQALKTVQILAQKKTVPIERTKNVVTVTAEKRFETGLDKELARWSVLEKICGESRTVFCVLCGHADADEVKTVAERATDGTCLFE
ncbi:MAG: Ribosome maturation protein SBDS [Amphiamblys sp. WSBS2006]|nr:MAG: Ribosome maturation protein SBDS [Amphiamblys sp. WSBS2006]